MHHKDKQCPKNNVHRATVNETLTHTKYTNDTTLRNTTNVLVFVFCVQVVKLDTHSL